MIVGVHHVAIATLDLARLQAFYCELFGLEVVANGQWEQGSRAHDALTGLENSAAHFTVLRLGDFYLELFAYNSPTPGPAQADRPVSDAGITHFCFYVADIDAEYERLRAAGVRFHTDPGPRRATRATYGRDPDGNVFELLEITGDDHPFAWRGAMPAATTA